MDYYFKLEFHFINKIFFFNPSGTRKKTSRKNGKMFEKQRNLKLESRKIKSLVCTYDETIEFIGINYLFEINVTIKIRIYINIG